MLTSSRNHRDHDVFLEDFKKRFQWSMYVQVLVSLTLFNQNLWQPQT